MLGILRSYPFVPEQFPLLSLKRTLLAYGSSSTHVGLVKVLPANHARLGSRTGERECAEVAVGPHSRERLTSCADRSLRARPHFEPVSAGTRRFCGASISQQSLPPFSCSRCPNFLVLPSETVVAVAVRFQRMPS